MSRRKKRKANRRTRKGASKQSGNANREQKRPEARVTPKPQPIESPQPKVNEGSPDKEHQEKSPYRWWRRPIRLNRAFTAALVFFTAVQCVVGWWQWDATNKQWEVMLDQIELQEIAQRPWIHFQHPAVGHLAPGESLKFIMYASNAGTTPGIIRRMTISIFIEPRDYEMKVMAERHKLDDPINDPLPVPPGVNTRISVPEGPVLTEEELAQINTGDLKIHVFCTVNYTDTSGDDHQTLTAFSYNPNSTFFTNIPEYSDMD